MTILCYSEYSQCPPVAQMQAWRHLHRGSMASSTMLCSIPAHTSIRCFSRSHPSSNKLNLKLPPSLRVPCQSATSECSPPSPGSDSAPKSVVGVSHRVFHSRLKTHLFPDSFPRNLPLSLTDWFHGFYLAYTEVSGVENIGQCGRLNKLSWLLGAV